MCKEYDVIYTKCQHSEKLVHECREVKTGLSCPRTESKGSTVSEGYCRACYQAGKSDLPDTFTRPRKGQKQRL
nr:uncharacterized protein CTRU02_02393 [Colletotrichum truncatum]KAF6798419.1 hypothetical protein CTRU02_02393 [Colletotrichum truncatum]